MTQKQPLSQKSKTVLKLIAAGHSYAQIVDNTPGVTYPDIFRAAEEALELLESPSSYHERLAEIKEQNPRAYERWSKLEDEELTAMYREGATVETMAAHLLRQPSAIQARLGKLGLDATGTKTPRG